MPSIIPALLQVLQPPYGWILLVVLAMPFWVLFTSVFLRGFEEHDQGSLFLLRGDHLTPVRVERDLVRYAGILTATWLLIIAFKVYQQYFTLDPIAHSRLSVFDLGLGLFSLASWAAMLMLRTQERL